MANCNIATHCSHPLVRSLVLPPTLPYSFSASYSQQSGSTRKLCGFPHSFSPYLALFQLWCMCFGRPRNSPHTLHSVFCLGHMLQLASQSTLLLTFAVSWHSSSSFAKSLGWAGTAIAQNIPQPPPLYLPYPLLSIEDCHTFRRLTTTFYSQNDKCLVCVCVHLMHVCVFVCVRCCRRCFSHFNFSSSKMGNLWEMGKWAGNSLAKHLTHACAPFKFTVLTH